MHRQRNAAIHAFAHKPTSKVANWLTRASRVWLNVVEQPRVGVAFHFTRNGGGKAPFGSNLAGLGLEIPPQFCGVMVTHSRSNVELQIMPHLANSKSEFGILGGLRDSSKPPVAARLRGGTAR